MKRKKWLLPGLILLAMLLCGGGFWWLFGGMLVERWHYYRFDSTTWAATQPEQRYYMACYLKDKDLLMGKTRQEILTLLGEPYSGSPEPTSRENLIYDLGPQRWTYVRLDDELLDIEFSLESPEPKAVKVRIRTS